MKIAQRDDWKTESMPSASELISVEELYSQDEFQQIATGIIPQAMEDKWFVFYEDPWLYIHRSWTGFCIFKVRFEMVAEGAKIAEVWVNRDRAQYNETDERRDAALLVILLDSWANRDTRNQMLSYMKSRSNKSD